MRRDGNTHLLRIRSVDDHVPGYFAAVESDVHSLAGHQPEIGQRLETGADQLGGPVLATARGPIVEPYRIAGLGAVRGRLDRSYDAGAQLTVVAGRRAHARPDDGPLGQPLAGARGQPVLLPHPDRQRGVQLDGLIERNRD